MTADTWAELICLCFQLSDDLRFNGKDLVKVISLCNSEYLWNSMDVDRNNVPHDHIGIFQDKYKAKGAGMQHCFYATKSGKMIYTKANLKWYQEIEDAKDLFTKFKPWGAKRQFNKRTNEIAESMKYLKNEDKEKNPLPTLAQDELLFSSAVEEDESKKLPSSSLLPPQACSSAPPIKLISWWDSSNAHKLFSPQGDEKTLDAVNNQIKILSYAVDLPENLSSMRNDADKAVEAMSEYKVHWLHGKCQLLSLALSFASKEAPKK